MKPWSVCAHRNAQQQGLTGPQEDAAVRPEHERDKGEIKLDTSECWIGVAT
jgi:hypothetical protein